MVMVDHSSPFMQVLILVPVAHLLGCCGFAVRRGGGEVRYVM